MSNAPQQSWLSRAAAFGRVVETALLTVLLTGLIFAASAQIVLRNFFSIGITWADGLVRLTVLWLALLGALAASRDGKHITMEALARWLPPKAQGVAEVCADLFAAIVCGVFAWFSLAFVRDTYSYGDTVLGNVPAWWFQSIMPLVFALIAYRYLIRTFTRWRGR